METSEVRHGYPTKASFKLTASTQGVSLEVDLALEKRADEDDSEYIYRSSRLLKEGWEKALKVCAELGLKPGKWTGP